jgi:lysozyme family protein
MRQNYSYALQEVLKSEGGYTNDPRDPGGATNFGITIADYRMYINPQGTPADVRNMSVDQAKEIYQSKYWNKVQGDALQSGVDYCVFDYGVNSGVSRANSVYQRLKTDNAVDTINAICDERLHFLQSLHTWNTFGLGWSRRVASVRANSIRLASTPEQPHIGLDDINSKVTTATSLFSTIKSFLSENIGSLGRHVSTGSIAAAGSVSAMFTKDWPYVLGAAIVLSVLIWAGLKIYERNHNASV